MLPLSPSPLLLSLFGLRPSSGILAAPHPCLPLSPCAHIHCRPFRRCSRLVTLHESTPHANPEISPPPNPSSPAQAFLVLSALVAASQAFSTGGRPLLATRASHASPALAQCQSLGLPLLRGGRQQAGMLWGLTAAASSSSATASSSSSATKGGGASSTDGTG